MQSQTYNYKVIDLDHGRFRQIIRGKIKQNLCKYISQGEMIARKGKDSVSIPLPQVDLPRFKWGEKQPMEMVCLVGPDLDNYARLTCHWGKARNPHTQPGMEAYFAQEPWDPVKP